MGLQPNGYSELKCAKERSWTSTEESQHVLKSSSYIGLAPCSSSSPKISSLNKFSIFFYIEDLLLLARERSWTSTEESQHVLKSSSYIGLAPRSSSSPKTSSLNKLSKCFLHRRFVAFGKRVMLRAFLFLAVQLMPTKFGF